MLIIGCDFHPSFQQIAGLEETGEVVERRLGHREEAEQFCRSLRGPVRVGMEACGHYPWFERLLGQPASPKSGEFEVTIMGARTEEMDGGTLASPARTKKTSLVGESKPFLRERNGALHGAHGEVLPKSA